MDIAHNTGFRQVKNVRGDLMPDNNIKNNPVIYIMTNPSFPEYVKIGYASDVDKRLSELNSSPCTPYAFRIYATYDVTKDRADIFLHKIIDIVNSELRAKDNLNGKLRVKEFFAIDKDEAYNILESIAKITNTEDRLNKYIANECEIQDEIAASEVIEKERRKRFSFNECKINPGDEISLIGNDSIVARVVDDRRVEYNGDIWLLSPLTQRLLNKNAAQGAYYWMFDGRRLTEIRDGLEEEND